MLDAGDDDEVEVVSFTIAGPSRHVPGARATRRSARPTRNKAPFVPQEIIEITDSDTEDGGEGSRTNDAGVSDQREPLPGQEQEKAPLFIAEPEDEFGDDVYMPDAPDDDDPYDYPVDGWPYYGFEGVPLPEPESPQHPPPDDYIEHATIAGDDDDGRIIWLFTGVLSIVPDVDPAYLRDLATRQLAGEDPRNDRNAGDDPADDRLLGTLVNHILEDPNYPKKVLEADDPSRPPSPKSPIPSSTATGEQRERSRGSSSSGHAAEKAGEKAEGQGTMHASSSPAKGRDRESDAEGHTKEELDPVSRLVGQVLEIVPDAEPEHVLKLVQSQLSVTVDSSEVGDGGEDSGTNLWERVLAAVLHNLFENSDYPKATKKRKRSETEDESGVAKVRKLDEVDYGDKNRTVKTGKYYNELALAQLVRDFPSVNHSALQTCFLEHNSLYAPTFFALRQQQGGIASHPVGDDAKVGQGTPKRTSSRKKGKGKEVQRSDGEFEAERAWLVRKLQEDDAASGGSPASEDDVGDGEGFECGCCFTEYPFRKMTQCPDAHLFCTTCVISYASTLLGEQNHQIACMDQSGCKLLFSPIELRRFLPPKLLELYERICQRKELEAAGLEGLEECPFCEYQVVIENEHEKLFRCERPDCGAVTCRKCKKMDHLPKSCEESESDKKLDARHHVEEAMTRALMRNCPKCDKAFIKESGCNKMVCPNCRTMSCYICRQIIKGYDHFNNPPPYKGPVDGKKCQLWDPVEQRHADEVTAAAKKAQEEYKLAHPEIEEADIKVDLPKQAAGVSNNPRAPPPVPARREPVPDHIIYAPQPPYFAAAHAPPVVRPVPLGVYPPHAQVGGYYQDVPVPVIHHPPPMPPFHDPYHGMPHPQHAAMLEAQLYRVMAPDRAPPPPPPAVIPPAAARRVRRRERPVALPAPEAIPAVGARRARARARVAAAPAPAPAAAPPPAVADAPPAPGRAAGRNTSQREREMLQRAMLRHEQGSKTRAILQAQHRRRLG